MRIVALGMLAFAVIAILTTVISSGGKPWMSVALVAGTLALDIVLNVVLIPRLGLAGAALATTIAMTAGALACALYVRVRYGGVTRLATIARVAAASIAVYALALLLPSGELFARMGLGRLAVKGAVAFEFVLLGVVYLALLFALREIGREEVRLVRRIAGI